MIVQGLQHTQTAIAFGLFFGDIGNYPEAVALARKHSNLNLLARDSAVIGGRKSEWLEKDAESVSADNIKWVKWIPVDPAMDNGKRKSAFMLGDFAIFGQFLQELVGNVRQSLETSHAP